jgi:hypothetical protein
MSPYLDLPCRSEAEAMLDKCEAIRAAVANFKTKIEQRIKEVGGQPNELLSYIDDGLDEALCGVERDAREAIDEDEVRLESEHQRQESGMAMFRSGVQFGRR